MRFVPKKLITFLGTIAFWLLIALLAVTIVRLFLRKRIPSQSVLEIHLERPLVERAQPVLFRWFRAQPPLSVRDVVNAIDHAADDKRVDHLLVHLGTGHAGTAKLQEIHQAILRFREQGKQAVAFAETFGQASGEMFPYYLATACDKIYLQPSGEFGLTGLVSQTMFFEGTLSKLGITPRLDSREEYKSAKYILTEDHYTPPHEQANRAIMQSLFDQVVAQIATRRKLAPDSIRSMIDRAPYSAAQAKQLGFVDDLAYIDQVRETLTSKDKFLGVSPYVERTVRNRGGKAIALIYGVGEIHLGRSQRSPFTGSMMGSTTIIRAFREAIDDKSVKAIVFRVNSPGGSYIASDAIWRAVRQAQDAGKPVIVSMSDVAASGGYFVAAPATRILADPGTITGSIGVVSGKLITTDFWNKLGITYDEIHTSKNATMHLPTEDYTPAQWNQLQATLDRIYNDFVSKVAQGRNMNVDQVKEIAGGRIWTGTQALENGLVDTLGGLKEALLEAKRAAGIKEDARVKVRTYPKRPSLLQALLGRGTKHTTEFLDVTMKDAGVLETLQKLKRHQRNPELYLETGIPIH